MNNTRFATAMHIMSLLDKFKEDWLTSDWIAGSININPVIVRKEIIVLKKYGLIESKQGKEGGVKLARTAATITLEDIYQAIKNATLLGKKNQHPNPDCSVGKVINKHLEKLYQEADKLVATHLKEQTLKNFTKKLK